jgi:hypothetical protein
MARSISAQPYYTLDQYRIDMGLPMCLFNGVESPNDVVTACDHCWWQWERDMVAGAIQDAMNLIAQHLKFKLGYEYLTDNDHPWHDPIVLNWGYIVGGGIQGLTDVSAAVSASDFTVDPATITVPQASFSGGATEILIVETSTGLEIVPDTITATGANYDIEIDQCKLIEWDNLITQDASSDCITYDNIFPGATWLKLADLTIYREYLDTSDQATIEFGPDCNCYWCGTACAGTTYSGCAYVEDQEISRVRVQLADYDAATGGWSCGYPTLYGCYHGSKASVNYLAGTTTEAPGWERAVRSLAHTFMVVEPCGCSLFKQMVSYDRRIPSVLTTERINCPFGEMNGAWRAWMWLQNVMQGRAYML